ncbi:MAG: ribonuclease HII [uncultured bacterium]|nr:MAG: ribonuclease HII [uncultured bacterium]
MKNKIAGVDEAGRGPLAGPVVAAAVILNPQFFITGLKDSKQLSEKTREKLFLDITTHCVFGIGLAYVEEIDAINILQGTLLAMRRAVDQLTPSPDLVLVDGNQNPKLAYPTKLIIRGDQLEPAISAASIVAKVTRDRLMQDLDRQYPGYGLAKHKGYGTKEHLAALQKLGPSTCHRKSFKPKRFLGEALERCDNLLIKN